MRTQRMTIPIDGHHLAVQVTDDSSRTLIDPESAVAFHSASGASAETRHVYLRNSGLLDRMENRSATSVLEVGLGTGMGLLLTLDAALASETPLSYEAIENDWVDADILQQLDLDKQLVHSSLASRFIQWRESLGSPLTDGQYRWRADEHRSVTVHLCDALKWSPSEPRAFDVIYFDPFAPDVNAELWQPEFLAQMHDSLRSRGRLVTYCVNRKVRDAFTSVGFDVQRVRGPKGGKREVLVATKS